MPLECVIKKINDGSFDYELILPTTINKLNTSLGLHGRDEIENGIDMYFLPKKIMDLLGPTNGGQICVEKKKNKKSISIKCEHYDHADGFLKFYKQFMI